MSEKGKIPRGRLGSLSLRKEGERQCFLFSKHLIICTRGSGGKLHLTKVWGQREGDGAGAASGVPGVERGQGLALLAVPVTPGSGDHRALPWPQPRGSWLEQGGLAGAGRQWGLLCVVQAPHQ